MTEDELLKLEPEVLPLVSTFPPMTLAVGSLIFAILLVIGVVLFNRKKSGARGSSLLLVGPSDAGKTAIFSRLVFGQTTPTTTSLQTNASVANLTPTKAIRIVDVPGHPRIRGQFTDHLSDAKVVAFVVDSNSISRNGGTVAEYLHHILHAITSLPPSQAAPALLIACNKFDILKTSASSGNASSLAITRVKTVLERELEKRRVAQTGGVGIEGLGEEGGDRSELGGLECGDGNAPFRFDDWEGGEIVFLATSARPGTQTREKRSELNEKSAANGLAALQECAYGIRTVLP